MEKEYTKRGFGYYNFADANGIKCSLQLSSAFREVGEPDKNGNIETENLIWFGCKDANPRELIPGKSWQPISMPKEYLADTRMHLTQNQVKELLPILQKFVKTGEI